MRGKGTFGVDTSTTTGITPAYAGKSLDEIDYWDVVRDHPRLCGEKFSARIFKYLSMGSPPPMRGKAAVR